MLTVYESSPYSQSHHQHSSHAPNGPHNSGSQPTHIDAKYSDSVNGHDTLTDFVTFVCQETDGNPQSSQVCDNYLFIY